MSRECNRSKTYLLPLLSDFFSITNKNVNNCIINTYTDVISQRGEYENVLALHCEFMEENADYEDFEKSIVNSELYIKHYEERNNVIFIIKFPDTYIREYNLYKQGLYSHFGDDCKIHIVRYWNKVLGRGFKNVPVIKKIKQILNKDPELNAKMREELNVEISLDQELGEAFNQEKEVINLSGIE